MHGILRTLLSPYLDKTAESIVFHSNEYGKPFVPDGIEFNMSYSAGRGLVGVACLPIGVDIEMVDPGKVTQEMIEEVFSDGERKSFFEDAPTALVRSFFPGMGEEESVVKAMGTGVSFPLRRVESRLDREGYAASIDEFEYYTCSLEECGTGYEAALTIAGAIPPAEDQPHVRVRPVPTFPEAS